MNKLCSHMFWLAHTFSFKRFCKILPTCLYTTLGLFAQQSRAEQPSSYTMVVNLSPAICAIDPSKQRTRQCLEGFRLTVSNLRPEMRGGKTGENCEGANADDADLSPLQDRVIDRVMPDRQQRKEVWRKNGGCAGMTAQDYFRAISNKASKLKTPVEFNQSKETVFDYSKLVSNIARLNPGLTEAGVVLRCANSSKFDNPIVTEIRVCYDPQGNYGICPSTARSNCANTVSVMGSP